MPDGTLNEGAGRVPVEVELQTHLERDHAS